jgi:hypothetical protein
MVQSPGLADRPKAVQRIATYLGVMSICSLVAGSTILALLAVSTGANGSVPFLLACVFPIVGAFDGVLALEFYRMRAWTYPIVRARLSIWWLSGP